MRYSTAQLKQPSPPSVGAQIILDGDVPAEQFTVRESSGNVLYNVISAPHTEHPSIKISVRRQK